MAADSFQVPESALRRRVSSTALEVATRRLDLTERGLTDREQQSDARLSLEQEKFLLDRSKQVEAAAITRFKLENERRTTIQSAMLIEKLGKLNPEDKNFSRDWTTTLAQHPDALGNDAVKQVMEAQRQRWTQFAGAQDALAKQKAEDDARKALADQKAQADKPYDNAKAIEQMSTALKHLDDIAVTSFGGKNKPPIPPELQNAKTFLTRQIGELTGAPATTDTPTAGVIAAPATPTTTTTTVPATTPVVPAPTAPAPTPVVAPSPEPIDFLRKALGTQPATPATSPVAAATSGLPDSTDAALQPKDKVPA